MSVGAFWGEGGKGLGSCLSRMLFLGGGGGGGGKGPVSHTKN